MVLPETPREKPEARYEPKVSRLSSQFVSDLRPYQCPSEVCRKGSELRNLPSFPFYRREKPSEEDISLVQELCLVLGSELPDPKKPDTQTPTLS